MHEGRARHVIGVVLVGAAIGGNWSEEASNRESAVLNYNRDNSRQRRMTEMYDL
jgi:hypothetical protein